MILRLSCIAMQTNLPGLVRINVSRHLISIGALGRLNLNEKIIVASIMLSSKRPREISLGTPDVKLQAIDTRGRDVDDGIITKMKILAFRQSFKSIRHTGVSEMPNDVLGREAIFVLPFLGTVLLAGEQHYTKRNESAF